MNAITVIIGLGEILWDVFPDGARFGGAPANFACSAAALCADRARVYMASSVGSDELGDRAIAVLREKSVDTTCVMRAANPTGQVLVQLDALGHAGYKFMENTAWDHFAWSGQLETLAGECDVCCFGTLAQRSRISRQTIRSFLATTPSTALRIFDVNLRPPFYSDQIILESIQLANVLKLNEEELQVLADLCGLSGTPIELLQQLLSRFGLWCVALTRGEDGAVLLRDDAVSEQPGIPAQVVDTVGAGDAFTATLALGLVDGRDLDDINRHACAVSAFVCSRPGATPQVPPELAYGRSTP